MSTPLILALFFSLQTLLFLAILVGLQYRQKLVFQEFLSTYFDKFSTQYRHDQIQRESEAETSRRAHQDQHFTLLTDSLLKRMMEIATLQKQQLDSFTKQLHRLTTQNDQRMQELKNLLEKRLLALQEDNNKKLELMRATVDEKLHATPEKRLGDSFKVVSDRLELVHKGLGEMQTLASGVGDLKRVLTNVKTRGTWGEVQLGQLLDQILTADQYETNVATKRNSNDRVEYALSLPGKAVDDQRVWLPIDAKFPQESYLRLLDAQEQSDPEAARDAVKELESQIKLAAKSVYDKYLDPPYTTDFALLFLPVEGLYAEILRIPHIVEFLQQKYRIILSGPTTLAALLNSLQMGFRTLAIEQRSSEVWRLLGTVKAEFGKFGDILDKTQKKLQEAGNTIETAARKSRTIERQLKSVESVSAPQPDALFDLTSSG